MDFLRLAFERSFDLCVCLSVNVHRFFFFEMFLK